MSDKLLEQEIATVLNMMNIHYKEISTIIDNDLHLTIFNIRSTQDTYLFFDDQKQLLRDLNTILKQLFQKKYHYFKNCIIDVNLEEKKLIDFTKEKAALAHERVVFFDKPYEFGYLNSYERMIIHSFLKNKTDVITESTGEGRDRRLIVQKKQAS